MTYDHSKETYVAREGFEIPKGWPRCPACRRAAENVTVYTAMAPIRSWNGKVIAARFGSREIKAMCCGTEFAFDPTELTEPVNGMLANMP